MRAQSRSSDHVADVRNDASANEWRMPSHHAGSYANRRASAHAVAPRASSAASAAMIATPVEMRRPPLFFFAGVPVPACAAEPLLSGLPAGTPGLVAVGPTGVIGVEVGGTVRVPGAGAPVVGRPVALAPVPPRGALGAAVRGPSGFVGVLARFTVPAAGAVEVAAAPGAVGFCNFAAASAALTGASSPSATTETASATIRRNVRVRTITIRDASRSPRSFASWKRFA